MSRSATLQPELEDRNSLSIRTGGRIAVHDRASDVTELVAEAGAPRART